MGVERTHGKSAHIGKVPSSRGRKEAGKRSVGVHKKGGTTEPRDIWEALSTEQRGQGKQKTPRGELGPDG